MILYDSKERLSDGETVKAITDSVREDLDSLCKNFKDMYLMVADENNYADLFVPRTVVRNGVPTNRCCGVTLYYNQRDGEPCGFTYYCADAETFREGRHHRMLINSNNFLIMSALDEEDFPEVKTLIDTLYEKYDLRNRSMASYMRNALIMHRERTFISDRAFLWNAYNTIKKASEKAHYTGSTIYFLMNGKEDSVRVEDSSLEYCGNFYGDANRFVDAYVHEKAGYSDFVYDGMKVDSDIPCGNDSDFRAYCEKRDYGILTAKVKDCEYSSKEER